MGDGCRRVEGRTAGLAKGSWRCRKCSAVRLRPKRAAKRVSAPEKLPLRLIDNAITTTMYSVVRSTEYRHSTVDTTTITRISIILQDKWRAPQGLKIRCICGKSAPNVSPRHTSSRARHLTMPPTYLSPSLYLQSPLEEAVNPHHPSAIVPPGPLSRLIPKAHYLPFAPVRSPRAKWIARMQYGKRCRARFPRSS